MRVFECITILTLMGTLALAACGDDTEPDPTTSDPTEPADQTDVPDPTTTPEATDPAEQSDPADESDPTEPEAMNCTAYLECVDTCWTTDPDTAETCVEDCAAATHPEALAAAQAYYACMNDCEETFTENDELELCYEENCAPLYITCTAPPECILPCENYDEVCGDDGPLNSNRTYLASQQRHRIQITQDQLVVALHAAAQSTPQLENISQLETFATLANKQMFIVHLDKDAHKDALLLHPAVRAVYPIFTNNAGHRLISTDEIVFEAQNLNETQLKTLLKKEQLILRRPIKGLSGTWLAQTQNGDSLRAADRLLSHNQIMWASPNFLRQYSLRHIPNDPYFPNQWHHQNTGQVEHGLAGADMRTTLAWDTTTGDSDIAIAINDDGVDLRHSDITFLRNDSEEIIGYNLPADIDEALAQGCCQHGTAVAGVSCAKADNNDGVVGVCPNCSAIPVWTNFGAPNEDVAVAETFTGAIENGAAIINNSWGPPDGNPAVIEAPVPLEPLPDVVAQAIEEASENGRGGKGAIIVFAAGNGNEDVASDPYAAHPLTIAVAALNSRGIKSSYSDFGQAIWVSAPSSGNHIMPGIVTTDLVGDLGYAAPGDPEGIDPDGDVTANFGGTSSAAPAVSGLIGLMLSANPELRASQVRDILRRTSRKIDKLNGGYQPDDEGFLKSPYYGYGLVDAYAAVRAAQIGCLPENQDLCLPALTCLDGPMPQFAEICNNLDDDCDGTVDNDVCPESTPLGEPCDLMGGCHDNCSWLENDPIPACLGVCQSDMDCAAEHTCRGGLCAPSSDRYSSSQDEICDGFDNNIDGVIDESGCEPSTDATCEFSAQCDASDGPRLCVGGFCAGVCTTNDDCEQGVECQTLASQYGSSGDDAICAPSLDTGLTCIEACIFLKENAPGAIFQSIAACITEATTCDEAIACVPL